MIEGEILPDYKKTGHDNFAFIIEPQNTEQGIMNIKVSKIY